MNYSPKPAPGKWFRFERNTAYALTVSYGGDWQWWARFTGRRFKARWGRWRYFSFDIAGLIHGYIGFKPINLHDPKFEVPAAYRSAAAVEFSHRFGVGDWS